MAILRMAIDDPGLFARLGTKPSVVAGTSIRRIDTMTRRTTKEILLEISAGRERQNQSYGDRAKHGDTPQRLHSLRHQPIPPLGNIKARGDDWKIWVITRPTLRCP